MSELKGVTKEYNQYTRKYLFDDINMRKHYKEDYFGDKKTITDPLTGEILHKSHIAARKKYQKGSNSTSWTKHASETDHIISLKKGHQLLKYNPILSDENVKTILNDPSNYRETSKAYNIAKGEKSDFSMLYTLPPKGKIQIVKDNIKAVTKITFSSTKISIKNVISELQKEYDFFAEAGISLMSKGVSQLIQVANNEKSFEDAIDEIKNFTAEQLLVKGGRKVSNMILKNLYNSNIISKTDDPFISSLFSLEEILKDCTLKYLSGSIDEIQYFRLISTDGISLVKNIINSAGVLTSLPTLAPFIAPIIISRVCSGLCNLYQSVIQERTIQKQKLRNYHYLANHALREMDKQRELLKQYLANESKRWDETAEAGFSKIINCSLEFDVEGTSDGIQEILSLFQKDVKFQTKEEFNTFFMNENNVLTF